MARFTFTHLSLYAKKICLKTSLVWVVLLTASCTGFPYRDYIQENTAKLYKLYPNVARTLTYKNRTLSYLYQPNAASQTLLVFVHGSPGNAHGYAYYLSNKALLERYAMLSIDRLGYEKSKHLGPERQLQKQAAAIDYVVNQYRSKRKVILVGHSFGGPVIARMGVDYPDIYRHLVMVAASVDPALEKTKWFQIPANWSFLRWLVPQDLDTSNQEILALKNALLAMENKLSGENKRVAIVHGTHDKLVPYENVQFLQKRYADAVVKTITLDGAKHFLPWSHPEALIDAIDTLNNRSFMID